MICPPGKSMSFHKKETEKIELVARPVHDQNEVLPEALAHEEVDEGVESSCCFAEEAGHVPKH